MAELLKHLQAKKQGRSDVKNESLPTKAEGLRPWCMDSGVLSHGARDDGQPWRHQF